MGLLDYKNHLWRLASAGSGELVLNGSPEHAAAILETMLAFGQKSVNILTRRFHPSVFGSDDLIDRALQFAARPEGEIRILVETNDPAVFENHPFHKRAQGNSSINFRFMEKTFANVVNSNFATMDGKAYRFEEDKTKALAVACFNNPEHTKSLDALFDAAWSLSKPLKVPDAAAA